MQILKAVKRCRKQHITPHQVNGGNKVITAPERPRRTPLLITTLPTFVYFLYQFPGQIAQSIDFDFNRLEWLFYNISNVGIRFLAHISFRIFLTKYVTCNFLSQNNSISDVVSSSFHFFGIHLKFSSFTIRASYMFRLYPT